MYKYSLQLFFFATILLSISSCGTESVNYKAITGTVENLPALDASHEYVAWIKDVNNIRNMGTINPNADGIAQFSFVPLPETISEASEVTVSIEDVFSNNNSPSESIVLKAEFGTSDEANLVASPIADFAGIDGTFILSSPTTTSSSTDNSGVWFVKEDITQGLTLPVLSSGWKYEGWVFFNNLPISTGKFLDPGLADEGNPYSGAQAPFPFPGEDFNKNAPSGVFFPVDLKNKIVKVSIEPEPDDSASPYISILQDTVTNPSVTNTNYKMSVVPDFLPSGTITKEKE